jgi:periplasmic copper chaperone A
MFRTLLAACAVTILFALPAFAHNGVTHHGAINISGPFARATLPNAPVGGGFMRIENEGPEGDRLVSVSSPLAGEVQIHEMKMTGDVMTMSPLPEGLVLPPGETVELSPGGYHLMLMGLTGPLVEGQTVPVTLVFEKAGPVEMELPILGAAARAPEHTGEGH